MSRKNRKSGSKKTDDSPGGGWEVVYSGFILIMLNFFIMLSSFSTMQEAKILQFVRSFISAVSIMPGGVKFDSGIAVLSQSADMVDSKNELAKIFKNLEELADSLNLQDEINLAFTREGLVMRLSEHSLFELGVATLSEQALALLQKIGAIIAKTAYFIRIEGHTDNLPIHTEMFPSNWELSTARAVNVLRYLIQNHNIDSQRLAAEGFSEFQPLVANDSRENRAKNRRVEIIFIRQAPRKTSIEETS